MSKFPSSYVDISHWINSRQPHLALSTSSKTLLSYFQITSHSQLAGARTCTYLFRGHNSTILDLTHLNILTKCVDSIQQVLWSVHSVPGAIPSAFQWNQGPERRFGASPFGTECRRASYCPEFVMESPVSTERHPNRTIDRKWANPVNVFILLFKSKCNLKN